ncbi:MAG: flagellar biosynthesis anti-sigma factor FlgM [Lachnospiraceae bacterium]|jgi:negative regulator of flagellin synthesis FlgM|nr:flagellar biosynthesis anti-sigma factor FlgM [Lachnospiraceae bacterium]MBO6155356.1 flagellar biosynthesis anti-sigma factor FlgM [Lachnospiraceae bacterium]MBQ2089179.1 flagellar biosynthesis anti-sigma factor FlgM [Lachnospiraceae bacterium]
MRIEAYTQVAQLYKTNNTSKAQATSNVAAARDEVQLSSFGRDYQIAKKAVAEASDIREDKVAEMKQKLASDNYQVDTGDFASKLLEKYNAAIL